MELLHDACHRSRAEVASSIEPLEDIFREILNADPATEQVVEIFPTGGAAGCERCSVVGNCVMRIVALTSRSITPTDSTPRR